MAKRIVTCHARFENVRDLKNLDGILTGKKVRTVCFKHPKVAEHVSLSGADGDDAKNYEEKNVGRAIENARKTK
jgi:hypothetical protein